VNGIWDNYNNKKYSVADSFIKGLRGQSVVVPLCITLGGEDAEETPLYDPEFTNEPNTSGISHYHILYPEGFESTPISPKLIRPIPPKLPILETKPVQPEYIRGELKPDVEPPILEEEQYIDTAWGLIQDWGWVEEDRHWAEIERGWAAKNFAEPMGVRFMIETTPVNGPREEGQQFLKNVIVTFKRQIDVGGTLVNVLGEGGAMEVQMDEYGSVLNASQVWREIVGIREEEVCVKRYDEAEDEALQQTMAPDAYDVDHWTWGYKEKAGNVEEQTELRIVFRFWFVPKVPDEEGLLEYPLELDDEELPKYPPQMIEIPGERECPRAMHQTVSRQKSQEGSIL
jgi:hypothetical protein